MRPMLILSVMSFGIVTIAPAARAGEVLFHDEFGGPAMSAALWHIPTWMPNGATFAGRTQFRVAQSSGLPGVALGHAMLGLQSYNPTGFSFLGDELISNQQFALGTGLDISYRARMSAARKCGVVGGLFVYGLKPGALHDEIDFELITNLPDQVQTNIYGNEALGVGRPLLVGLPSGTIGDEHEYEIRWTAATVTWLVDGKSVRSVAGGVPTGPADIYLNIWATSADWRAAYCAGIAPVRSISDNVLMGNLAVGSVRATKLP
jgi:hypothetical protein